MAKNIELLAKKLGAEIIGRVPEYSAGAFGVAVLAKALRERLEPSRGKRPGRPSNPKWVKRPKVPMAPETEQRLKELAHLLSDDERRVTPMQVAAQILEDATASYIPHRPTLNARRRGRGTKP
jgi:hypothetical protein